MLQDCISVILLLAGFFFLTIGTIGLLRMPDVYTRMHATAKCDTLGAGLVITAMIVKLVGSYGDISSTVKLLAVWAFFLLINPTVTHMIAESALARDVELSPGTDWMFHESYDSADVRHE